MNLCFDKGETLYMKVFFKLFLLLIITVPAVTFGDEQQQDISEISGSQQLITVPYDVEHDKLARDIFISMIDGAQKSVDLMMYQLKDQAVIESLMRAQSRGLKVRIITENNPYKHGLNTEANVFGGIGQLRETGVPVQGLASRFWFSEDNHKGHAHSKILIIDGERIAIMSLNWDESSFRWCRDFALIINKNKNPTEVADIVGIFNADWNNEEFDYKSKLLVVGPGHGLDRHSQRNEFINLFLSAKESIEIYIQSYNDEEIAQVLEKICHEGKVKVRLLKVQFPFGEKGDENAPFQNRLIKAGGEVRFSVPGPEPIDARSENTRFYIHAKVVIIDGKEAYIGSCNFYTPSLEYSREIGIVTQDVGVIKQLKGLFKRDWELAAIPAENIEKTNSNSYLSKWKIAYLPKSITQPLVRFGRSIFWIVQFLFGRHKF
jgi:cardiolipin synthase A/B